MARLRMLKPRVETQRATSTVRQPDSRRESLRTYAWKKLRAEILERDCGLCQPCKAKGHVTLATEVDHKIPRAQGGTDHPSNLQAICNPCHEAKTRTEQGHGDA